MEFDYKLKVILCGESGVGKSSFFNYLKHEENFIITPTIGVDFLTINHVYKDKRIKLNLWDTAGEERFRAIISSYFKDISAYIIMFDLTNLKSLQAVPYWISIANKNSTCDYQHPIFLIGNKNDLINKEKIDFNLIEQCLLKYKITYYEEISSIDKSFDSSKFLYKLTEAILNMDPHSCNGIVSKNDTFKIKYNPKISKINKKCCYIL